MKKIISFSLWGNNPKYTIGALKNIDLQKKLFPDWICRFYVHESVPKNIVKELKNKKAEIIHKEGYLGEKMYRPGMFWRFEVIKDLDVERFISRDVDGRLTLRERNAIQDWILSKKNFHIIRDHRYHSTRIMGGMWGCTEKVMRKINYDALLEKFNHLNYKSIYGSDQDFLALMIYSLIKNDCLIHDEFHFYKEEQVKKIPHLRLNNEFVGQPFDENDIEVK